MSSEATGEATGEATILAVDDVAESLTLLVDVLTSAGYRALPADSGELALAAVAANPPDLILLDVHMPGVGGLEVCRRLKAREETRHLAIILTSATADRNEAIEGLQLGAADYIAKPFQTEELLARVRTHLSLSRANILLEQQAAAVRQTNEELQSEIAERSRVESELRQSLERAERSRQAMLSALEDQTRAETALRESERRFRETLVNLDEGYYSVSMDGVLLEHNQAFSRLLGFERDADLRGSRMPDFWQRPDERKGYLEELATKGSVASYQIDAKTRTGEGIIVLASAHLVKDENERPSRIEGVFLDVTERLRLSSELRQAQKMESVGRLAGGVAHDYNNMLNVILGYTELALEKVDPTEPLHGYLEEIRKAAQRSTDLTRQLLAFAHKQTIAPEVLDLNLTVERTLNMLRRLIGEDVGLDWVPGVDLWSVKADPAQMDQILANLCVNARDAIAGVGSIRIETGNASFDKATPSDHPRLACQEYVFLAVSDDGQGMDKETQEKIFEPFFTTKGLGQGTGLGLATVYGIVIQNDGFIEVRSEPGDGSTFKLYLPRHLGERIDTPATHVVATPRGSGELVLVVEDEDAVLGLVERMLGGLGYEVLTARDPKEALALVEGRSDGIRLLIADVVMPELNGRELAGRVQALQPDIAFLFMSGYTADVIAHRGVLNEGVHFIQKPFSISDLAEKVREALGEA